ncbi:MAG: SMP-30/gluconolactonase/LRE family protein [Devosia sp.]|uniref:SMP-30/gluconolactonase/LRE family protein n=1 Tax=Devosia sp. TaxID=1871048 RepID=UPI001AC8DF2E|nr:SMP-30/gluconolactonase/LRE family protein [Devosia sp.]MBN9315316.1 SMP-30/gluconolactonase/LRE family protein [Devosia sp.]
MSGARLALASTDIVGESIIWVAAEQALYWVDIVGSRIHRFVPESGEHQIWPTPEYPTSIGLRKAGGFIVGLRQRVALWTPGGSFETFAVPEPELPGNRLNEGAVAPDGSYWVGTMAENIGPDGTPQPMSGKTGRLYRIAPDGTVTALCDDRFGITNTMVWTDDRRFITADTIANQLYQYDLVAQTTLSNRRPLLGPIDRGLPDGSTRDADGVVFNARVAGGGAIARIDAASGRIDYLDLPCKSPTSCCFGGRGLDVLYVTSARFGMTANELEDNLTDGALFAVQDVGRGIPPMQFG